jgi:hypothetical protein
MSPVDDPADVRGPLHGVIDRAVLLLQRLFAWIDVVQRRRQQRPREMAPQGGVPAGAPPGGAN